jgi:hypothetical protein
LDLARAVPRLHLALRLFAVIVLSGHDRPYVKISTLRSADPETRLDETLTTAHWGLVSQSNLNLNSSLKLSVSFFLCFRLSMSFYWLKNEFFADGGISRPATSARQTRDAGAAGMPHLH